MNDVWNKLCRSCLTPRESFSYFLFRNVSAETYSFCTSIQVREEDNLPKSICNSCYELMSKYSEFKKTCIESQNTLLLCDQSIKSEDNVGAAVLDDKEVDSVLNVQQIFENVEKLEEHDHADMKEESFHEDSTPELTDTPFESEKFTHKRIKRKKLKILKIKALTCKSDSQKKRLHYSCEICQKKFKYRKRFETHRQEHNGAGEPHPNQQCIPCNKTFVSASGLRRHEASVHAGVRLAAISCALCGRVCASKHSLKAHEKSHYAARSQAVCHVCGKRVSSHIILRAHLETHKADRERLHTCEHCGKKFLTNAILLSHIKRLHTGLRYICGICEYPFTDKHNLAKHLLIHEGKKLYKCEICDKSYATNGSLVEHKRIHSGERPFNCHYCPKSFISKRRLIDHHRIHTGDKPHRCAVCEQRFTQRGTLKRHMKVHNPMKTPQLVE